MPRDHETIITTAVQFIAEQRTDAQGDIHQAATERYVDEQHFALEQKALFGRLPSPLLHVSSVAENNSYQAVESTLGSLIVSRDNGGHIHVFRNACRHRGAKLVEGKGCKRRFTCPYHAWSFATDGALVGVPGEAECFPGIDKQANSLIEVPCTVAFGLVWILPAAAPSDDLNGLLYEHLGDMSDELQSLHIETLKVFASSSKHWDANWKLLAEGGLETYHFAVAHRNTIAPYFHNNVAVIDQLGQHFRVFMPTKVLQSDTDTQPLGIHDCSHTVYLLMPNTVLLVQQSHIDMIQLRPISAQTTVITITTLIPQTADLTDPKQLQHWQRNVEITHKTLDEDWALGESLQASLTSKALPYIQYGRNEWALKAFNHIIDDLLNSSER